MTHYSAEIKEAMLKRMMPPNATPISLLSEESNIPLSTLYNWRTQSQHQGIAMPSNTKKAQHWSAADKLAVVFETRALNQAELGEYCRKKGLYREQIEAWEAAALSGYEQKDQRDKQTQAQSKADQKSIKRLEAELKRKNAALAETAALLVLSKKSRAIWGESEDV